MTQSNYSRLSREGGHALACRQISAHQNRFAAYQLLHPFLPSRRINSSDDLPPAQVQLKPINHQLPQSQIQSAALE
ncbi:MAG: hypothetical protein M1608_08000 [Candidatus Omnitrophica bacterium]|nr:hypothetical protein [Candidatus Omnitrophota bacterium]